MNKYTATPVTPPDDSSIGIPANVAPGDLHRPMDNGDWSPLTAKDKAQTLWAESTVRSWVGCITGCVGFVAVFYVIHEAFDSLSIMSERLVSRQSETLMIVIIAAHACVAIAAIYFSYQLLRLAERMLLPKQLLNSGHVSTIQALTGIRTPVGEARRAVSRAWHIIGIKRSKRNSASAGQVPPTHANDNQAA